MEYWKINNKTKVPKLGFGTWLIKGKQCVEAVQFALEIGYRHIDTAQIYENEEQVGQGIADSGVMREDIFLVTKVWRDNLSAKKVEQSTEESLRKLKTDYVDLLLIHWPEIRVSLEESLLAMRKLVKAQKIKFIGVSNFPVDLVEKAKQIVPEIVCNQVEYHPFLGQGTLLSCLRKNNMFLTAYSPLARNKIFKDKTVCQIAKKYSKTAGQVVLRWLLEQENVVAIPKAGNREHAESNFDIFDFHLKDPDPLLLGSLYSRSMRLVDPKWGPKWDK